MAVTLQDNARDAGVEAITDLCDSGTIEIKTAASTVAGTNEIAILTFGATAFGAASSGVVNANAITDETNANAGTASDATFFTSGSAAILQCSVGTSGEDINFSSVSFGAGDTISITSLSVTQPAS